MLNPDQLECIKGAGVLVAVVLSYLAKSPLSKEGSSMKWGWLTTLLKLVPYIVAGVETVAGANASGATKKQMALDALQVATAGAESVDPADAVLTDTISQLTGLVIDSTVTHLTGTGVLPSHKVGGSTRAPAPLPSVAVAVADPVAVVVADPVAGSAPGLSAVVPE